MSATAPAGAWPGSSTRPNRSSPRRSSSPARVGRRTHHRPGGVGSHDLELVARKDDRSDHDRPHVSSSTSSADDAWTLVDTALGWASFPLLFSGHLDEAGQLAQEAADLGAKLGHVAGETLRARRAVTIADFFTASTSRTSNAARSRTSMAREHRLAVGLAVARVAGRRPAAPGRPRRVGRARRGGDQSQPESAWAGLGQAQLPLAYLLAGDHPACQTLLAEARPAPRDRETPGPWAATSRSGACRVRRSSAISPSPRRSSRQWRSGPTGSRLAPSISPSGTDRGDGGDRGAAWDAAEEHFARARRRADEMPNSVDRPQVLHWHARMLLDRGDPADRPLAPRPAHGSPRRLPPDRHAGHAAMTTALSRSALDRDTLSHGRVT